jgi:hypothetical protein
MVKGTDSGRVDNLVECVEGRYAPLFSVWTPTRFTIDHSPGRICARALLAVASSSMNRR